MGLAVRQVESFNLLVLRVNAFAVPLALYQNEKAGCVTNSTCKSFVTIELRYNPATFLYRYSVIDMRFFAIFMAMGILMLSHSAFLHASDEPVWLEVTDPFFEMRTGPGRGFPVFHSVEQGESIEVLTRRPDWYEVRTASGKTGWTKESELSRTLQATGVPVDLPSVGYGDYLKSSWRVGFSTGQFSSGELNGSNNFSLSAGYRPLSWLGLEVEGGKTYSSNVRGEFYGANVLLEPFSDWLVSPYLLAGVGQMNLGVQPKLILSDSDSRYNTYGLGGSYYLGRNFVIRGEYRWNSVFADSANNSETVKLQEWKIGFSTFF